MALRTLQLTLSALLLTASLASAQTAPQRPTARLRYARLDDAANACPSLFQTEAAVRTRLGYDPFRDDAKDVIEVFVEKGEPNGLRARMRLKDADGTSKGKRDLLSPSTDCVELSNALTLAISIAVDPQSFLGPSTPAIPSAESGGPPPPPIVAASPPPPPPMVEAESSRVKVRGGIGILGLAGTTFGITGGASVRLTVGTARWSVSLDGRGELPRVLQVGPGEISVTNAAGLLAPCLHVSFFGACAVAGVGATRIGSTGLDGSRDQVVLFFQAGGRVQAMFDLTERISLGGALDVLVPVTRPVLRVGGEPLWSAPVVNGNLGVFLSFSFT